MDVRKDRHSQSRLARRRHPARRDGVVAAVLFSVPAVMALVLIWEHRRPDAGTLAVLVSVSLTLPALWLTWAGYRNTQRSEVSGSVGLARVADQLAMTVGAQWLHEAAVRRLNDPYPLPVSWAAVVGSLADSWDSIVKLARSGAGRLPAPPADLWAVGPDGLAGRDGDLGDVLDKVPTGRLVVLGEPGAGKSMLMVRLVLDLLARRTSGGPVPVLVSIPSWDPRSEKLRDWIVGQLIIDYPALGAPAPAGTEGTSYADALLAAGLIVPVLDGLDEIPEAARGPAITRINDGVQPGQRLVITCRTSAYREAVHPPSGFGVRVRGAGVVQLRPLDAAAVSGYLLDDTSGPAAAARWAPVLAALRTQAPVAKALTTPLMAGLARIIYNPRPGEIVGSVRDPAELCAPDLMDRAAVEALLLDGLIPAAYRQGTAGRWSARQVQAWLQYLARYLEFTIIEPDLAWWQLPRAVPRLVLAVIPALVAAIILGAGIGLAAGAVNGVATALATCLAAGLLAWILAARSRAHTPVRPSRAAPVFGFAAGIVTLVIGAAGQIPVLVLVGLGAGAASIYRAVTTEWGTIRLRPDPTPEAVRAAPSPSAALRRDHRTLLLLGGVLVFALALTILVAVRNLHSVETLKEKAGAGIALAGFFWIIGWSAASRWSFYLLAKIWLASQRRLPLSLMRFLADAHQRGILRQAGASYQFRHIELQRRLARTPANKRPAPASISASPPFHPER
jgi:hypothetical protein